ncbi:MAG: YbjN domain-containing protein [Treponema sp.]|jgi:hypothetical protein|nr:YbjN domain-containing protein [Treponema sp.]
MEMKELQHMYLDLLKEEGYKGNIDEDGDITFKYEGETYWIIIDEEEPEFFELYYVGNWKFKDDDDIVKGLRAVNAINRSKRLIKMHMNEKNGSVGVDVELFVQEPKDFVSYLSRSLFIIQGAIDSFIEDMEKE